jgi:tetratricopeptide (TPR) repeat protein
LGELANLYLAENKFTEAEELYQRAIALSDEVGNPVSASQDRFNLAVLYEGQERLAEARTLLEQVIEIEAQLKLPLLKETRHILASVQEAMEAKVSS